jgi:hypothetical protein
MSQSNIYLIESPNRQELALTFMRFQEYYESPEFAGKFFSADEFAAWYAKEHGAFTYHKDWSGFNIPSWVLEPFKVGNFDPLTAREQKLINFFRNKKDNFYIIGVTTADEECAETLKHEFVHGAFYTNGAYRQDVIQCLQENNPRVVKVALTKMGYGPNVLEDESNAYLLTEPETLEKNISWPVGEKLQNKLDRIFQKYFGFSMIASKADKLAGYTERLSI